MKTDKTKILDEIKIKSDKIKRTVCLMELCGTHSQAVATNGIKNILPKNIKLLSGPGCPVCVTDQGDIDIMVKLALNNVPLAVYGDILNVPGNTMSLEQARQNNADISVVYSVDEALKIKKINPKLVFFGLGFETTAPMTAWAIKNNLTVYSTHKLFPPAMDALLKNKDIKIDGFINPGHVSAIIGTKVYEKFKVPQVITGFDGADILKAIDMLLEQILKKQTKVENEYQRVVKKNGNAKAQKLINEVFEIKDTTWRGLGIIKNSGLKIKKKYQKYDAEFIYQDIIKKIKKEIKIQPSACQCGLVLQGIIEPRQCKLFNKICTPNNPQGACMVSVEGACNIEYRS
ncbi:MAG: hydrogenase formation protein HypD [Patescibacteria group bacterium]|nr:hydrogenase formation protein HypD [Patescibacteria group bacterium]MBU1870673.1 hydrogenase formation protein HypD [Patescibacteria group bacterium]